MAKQGSAPASSAQNVEVDTNDPWNHVVVDAEGSAAFDTEDEAKAYAKDKGVALDTKSKNADGDEVTNPNLVKLGMTWVLLNTEAKEKKSKKSDDDENPDKQ